MNLQGIIAERLPRLTASLLEMAADRPGWASAILGPLGVDLPDEKVAQARSVLAAIPAGAEDRVDRAVVELFRSVLGALDNFWDTVGTEVAMPIFGAVIRLAAAAGTVTSAAPPRERDILFTLITGISNREEIDAVFGCWAGNWCARSGILREQQARLLSEVCNGERGTDDLDLLRSGGNLEVTERQWREILAAVSEPEKFGPLRELLGLRP